MNSLILYSHSTCPHCHALRPQRRGTRYRVKNNGDHRWMEQRTCTGCGEVYAIACLPYLAQALDEARPLQPKLV